MLPSAETYHHTSAVRRLMVNLEYENDAIIHVRERPEELDPARARLADAVDLARRLLLEEVKRRRIVVEVNPGSNLRISGARRLQDSPAVSLLRETRNGLLVCVNTDNPGVFGSRIENQYALLLQGLEEAGESPHEARAMLEQARAVGMDLLHWPPRPSHPAEPTEIRR